MSDFLIDNLQSLHRLRGRPASQGDSQASVRLRLTSSSSPQTPPFSRILFQVRRAIRFGQKASIHKSWAYIMTKDINLILSLSPGHQSSLKLNRRHNGNRKRAPVPACQVREAGLHLQIQHYAVRSRHRGRYRYGPVHWDKSVCSLCPDEDTPGRYGVTQMVSQRRRGNRDGSMQAVGINLDRQCLGHIVRTWKRSRPKVEPLRTGRYVDERFSCRLHRLGNRRKSDQRRCYYPSCYKYSLHHFVPPPRPNSHNNLFAPAAPCAQRPIASIH